MKKIYGNHLGLVISGGDEDPEGRGRCQVFIPHVSNTLYKSWNQKLQDIEFMTLAQLDGDIIKRLKQTLPWAECAAPIFGGSTNTAYNPYTGVTASTYAGTTKDPAVEKSGTGAGNNNPNNTYDPSQGDINFNEVPDAVADPYTTPTDPNVPPPDFGINPTQ